jgi:hypothetical protein
MRMDVDRACHYDLAGHIIFGVEPVTLWLRDDVAIFEPNIAHAVGLVDGINNMGSTKTSQHGTPPKPWY